KLMNLISAKNKEMVAIGARSGGPGAYSTFKEEASKWIRMQGGIASVDTTNEKIEGDTATVAYTVRWGNGRSDSETMKLVKENGVWKVSQFLADHDSWLKDNY